MNWSYLDLSISQGCMQLVYSYIISYHSAPNFKLGAFGFCYVKGTTQACKSN